MAQEDAGKEKAKNPDNLEAGKRVQLLREALGWPTIAAFVEHVNKQPNEDEQKPLPLNRDIIGRFERGETCARSGLLRFYRFLFTDADELDPAKRAAWRYPNINDLIAEAQRRRREKVPAQRLDDTFSLNDWMSQTFGHSDLVKQRVAQEGKTGALCLGSCVEFGANERGWREGDLAVREVHRSRLGSLTRPWFDDDEFAAHQSNDLNYSLVYLRDPISDEPGWELQVVKLFHNEVRFVANQFGPRELAADNNLCLLNEHAVALPNSIVVHVVVVTTDDKLLIGRRSGRPRFYENTWAVTFEEHFKPTRDGTNPVQTVREGCKEELIGHEFPRDSLNDIRLFSIFREYDRWKNETTNEIFWDINIGLAGVLRLPLTSKQVLETWSNSRLATHYGKNGPEDAREFSAVVAIDYTPTNLIDLARSDIFDPRLWWEKGLQVASKQDRNFPELRNPLWLRQHPTNKIRLARLLTADHRPQLLEYARRNAAGNPAG